MIEPHSCPACGKTVRRDSTRAHYCHCSPFSPVRMNPAGGSVFSSPVVARMREFVALARIRFPAPHTDPA